MPLIVLTGLPCSGKSTRAEELVRRLAPLAAAHTPPLDVVLHLDLSLGISRTAYELSASEKSARGTQMLAVKRDLSNRTVVVLDTPAYIKGWRYQLHCEAKEQATGYCVVYTMASLEQCLERNNGRYPEETVRALEMRYEEPHFQNRWEQPLFAVAADDELPVEEIWKAVVEGKALKPNNVTVAAPSASGNYTQELDRLTSEVVREVQGADTGTVVVEGVRLDLPLEGVLVAQLQRHRRAFVQLNRIRPITTDRIKGAFIEYLQRAWE